MSDSIPPPLPGSSDPGPPPLPTSDEAGDGTAYSTRNDAFSPAVTWRLRGATLVGAMDHAPERTVRLADVVEVRLRFDPTRMEPHRHRCRLRLRGGATVDLFNRSYVGVGRFRDTSRAYREFVQILVAAVAREAPRARLVAGAGAGAYGLSMAGFALVVLAVVAVGVFAVLTGLWTLLIVKALIVVFYLPSAWRWLRRNRETGFAPGAIPDDVLPATLAETR